MKPNDLRSFRRRHGLNQTEAGKLFGVKKLQVSRWETGYTTIPAYVQRIVVMTDALAKQSQEGGEACSA